ncbi:RHS repeat domain-containing protein [Sorangium sp. So ce124]|uniref:RHS repeat domain-containing protein n=1 Tax=Sorangium sp. So ce124 TaxID=3133280 RepID=UPI003F5FF1B9
MLAGATGQRLRVWNGRGFVYRSSYDALRRPTHEQVQLGSGSERLARRYVYGEAHPQATALNLRGTAYQVYDGAGVVTSQAYDFKGNVLQASRRLRSDVHADADWSVLSALTDAAAIATAAEPLLETESFGTQTAYDALNRPTSVTAPDTNEVKPTYNEAGLLERVEARVRGVWTTFVDNIDYDAKGQRERIEYGNGTSTAYTYDPLTFRLSRLKTTRSSDSAVLQNLTYVYDPVGNIVEIGDSAQQTVFFNNAVVSPSAHYVYDAVYRLIEATGREHAGGLSESPRDQNDLPIQSLPHANDAQALRNYTEQYVYDAVGNLQRMVHQAGTGSWTRWYAYEETGNNRLTSTTRDPVNGPFRNYAHDAHGNMTLMPHITALTWDENDQLRSTDLGGGGVVYYTYSATGQRVRKVWEHNGLVDERIYLGGYEVYRRRSGSGLVLERQTLHVMDGARRVAMVETKTVDTSGPFTVTPRVRYQLDNHLGSASLEVDGAGLVIGYEEYHPYGTTAYWSAASGIEVSQRRYRYTGKEKDEETGLYYHGARYYAPWLGRWTAADPAGLVDGPNLYAYVSGNPIVLRDPTGRWDERVVPAPAPGMKKPDPPPPPGKDFAAQKAAEEARQAAEQAENLGAEIGGKFGEAIGEADEALKTLTSLNPSVLPRNLKSNPKFVEELQAGLAEKLNAIPELPTFTDPKLAEAAQRGFERGFGGGLDEARTRAVAVNLASGAALALSPAAVAGIERAGAAALRGALARFRDMPIFLPGAAGGAGGFLRVPKPPIAQAAGGEAPVIRQIADTPGLQHSFSRHANQWFGGEVTPRTHMSQWQALVERTAASSKQVAWSTGDAATVGHLARIDGKYFLHSFTREGLVRVNWQRPSFPTRVS